MKDILAIIQFDFYFRYNGSYEYPMWAAMFGWSLALSSMVIVPIYCIYITIVTPNTTDVSIKLSLNLLQF